MNEHEIPRKPASPQHSIPTTDWPSCTCCGNRKPDMKKCSKCKSVFYCSSACQAKDWTNIHNKICRTLQALHESNPSSQKQNPRVDNEKVGRCGNTYCRVVSKDLKVCTRCRNISYCSQDCQRKDWKNHKAICTAPRKAEASKYM